MAQTSAAAGRHAPGSWRETFADESTQPFPWWSFLITGVLGMAFGAAVLVWPDVTLRIMAAITGIWLFVGGLARILSAFLPGGGSLMLRLLSLVVGIVILIAGLVCLRNLVARVALLALMFAITWILGGVTAVVIGLRQHGVAEVALIAYGVLSLIAGGVLLVTPALSLATLVVLTGVSSLIVGAGEVIIALLIPKGHRHPATA